MQLNTNKSPQECAGMEDIREQIDRLDKAIVSLLSQRFEYVKAAAAFKTSTTSVRAPQRFDAMLSQRREWAEQQGLNPDAIEKMYRDLVNYFIEEELKNWQDSSPS